MILNWEKEAEVERTRTEVCPAQSLEIRGCVITVSSCGGGGEGLVNTGTENLLDNV